MSLVCVQLGLFVFWIFGSWGWLSNKCILYEKVNYWMYIHANCPSMIGFTASCWDIYDLKVNLSVVPSNYQTLCLEIRSGYVMQSGALSRFYALERLHLEGFLPTILHGTFKGLSSVKTLSLNCKGMIQCNNASLLSNTFRDLTNLEELSIDDCMLSVMALDVFGGIPLLKKLTVNRCCAQELSDLLCRIVNMSQSITSLTFKSKEIVTLRPPNCSDTKGAVLELPHFYRLQEVRFSFPNAHHLDKGAFKCFENITELSVPMVDEPQTQLLQSGIKRLQAFDFYNKCISFESVCETVFKLSITEINVRNDQFWNTTSAVRNCQGIKKINLNYYEHDHDALNLSLIHDLKNLVDLGVFLMHSREVEISMLCDIQKGPVLWLKKLCLLSFQITNITSEQFGCLKNLKQLILSGNQITTVADFTFKELAKLRFLDLRNNKISQITENSFFGLHVLETLILEQNPLETIEAFAFIHLTLLKHICLGDFQPLPSELESSVNVNLTHIFGVFPQGLMHMNISSMWYTLNIIIGSNSTPKPGIFLQLSATTVFFQDCWRPFFQSVVSLTAITERLLCGSHFAARYFTSLQYFGFNSVLSAEFVDMTDLNTLVEMRYLFIHLLNGRVRTNSCIVSKVYNKLD
ncbi:leucine-rich repeat-containing protein 15-like [Oncorhynchus mykiss]|uniref:leucine-rich repeat-containing protein 15-like n=1 Tax=Oncorhynchus mykiss TaxID=8022 RepID=UPI001878BC3B|nr:leucine-rich repeat-containing protein 15-like [Oncorhynchus mykiss]